MKLLLLSDPNSSHTIKWVRGLAGRGIEIILFGLSEYDKGLYDGLSNVNVITLGMNAAFMKGGESKINKLLYLKALPRLKRVIKEFKPDIVHAHYVSSYGLLAALSGFRPLVLSVWGMDIFSFPVRSWLHRKLIEFNLKRADTILSTSNVMAIETKKYTEKNIIVTPFGIDLNFFKKRRVKSIFDKKDIVIGTIKSLEQKYGIEHLIQAFHIVKNKIQNYSLKLLIVGGGIEEKKLKELTRELKITGDVVFTGKVKYDEIPKYQNMIDISVTLSVEDSESFGVSILEACACEKPVVVSDVGGLSEIVLDGVTGYVVPPADPDRAAQAIKKLVLDNELRKKMGWAGRSRVQRKYNWENSIQQMIHIYTEIMVNK